jgi:hypothetical protein
MLRYSRLEASGALQPIRNPDLPSTRPILEDDLRYAIESLEASTAMIQKQTETLRSQYDSLNKQLGLVNNLEQQRNRDVARLRRKHEEGRMNTTLAVRRDLLRHVRISLTPRRPVSSPTHWRPSLGTRQTSQARKASGFWHLCRPG